MNETADSQVVVEITEITEDDEYMFEFGDCHTLALAINRQTGWQLAAIGKPDEACGGHAFVITPTGQALDIRGPRPVQKLLREYRAAEWSTHTVATIEREFGIEPYEDEAPGRANQLVGHLVGLAQGD